MQDRAQRLRTGSSNLLGVSFLEARTAVRWHHDKSDRESKCGYRSSHAWYLAQFTKADLPKFLSGNPAARPPRKTMPASIATSTRRAPPNILRPLINAPSQQP